MRSKRHLHASPVRPAASPAVTWKLGNPTRSTHVIASNADVCSAEIGPVGQGNVTSVVGPKMVLSNLSG
jgi:hypothetical protein